MISLTKKYPFIWYLVKFLAIYCFLYFGTIAWIGLAAPGKHYVPFIEKYLDYISWIKLSLLHATSFILSLFKIDTLFEPGFLIRFKGGRGVIIAMDCVGYGVYSFWAAFVIANKGEWGRKLLWITGGILGLWLINVLRITLFLTAINKGWPMPFNIDHHTWFNIFAYLLIFILIWWYDKRSKLNSTDKKTDS